MHDPLRPTFEHDVSGVGAEALLERIAEALAADEGGLPHRRAGHHLLIWLPKSQQHMWSPWLHLDVNESETSPGTATLFGRFTPAPSMWTAIMFAYLALGFLALCAGVFGYSQWLVGSSPWALWIVPICAGIAVAIPLASRAGQAMARDQMGLLTGAVARALPAHSATKVRQAAES